MATATKFDKYVFDLMAGVHQWDTHTFKVALTNVAPSVTDTLLSDITEIADGGGYLAGGYTLDTVVLTQATSTTRLFIADETIVASGAAIAAFRYYVIYNFSATLRVKPLVLSIDRGSSKSFADGENVKLDFSESLGLLSIA